MAAVQHRMKGENLWNIFDLTWGLENSSVAFWGLRCGPAGPRHPLLSVFLLKKLHHLLPELLSHEGVEDRVDAAVEQSQAVCYHQSLVNWHPQSTVKTNQIRPHEDVHNHGRVVRHPAQQEHHHHSYDDLHGPVLPETSTLQHLGDGDAVAIYHHKQREQKAKNMAETVYDIPPWGGAADVKVFVAEHPLWVRGLLEGFVEKSGKSEDPTAGPNHHAEEPATLPLSSPDVLTRVHDHQITVDANAGQEEDAGVEVCIKDEVEELAQEVPKDPSFKQCDGPERDGEGHQTVCYRQVEQVQVRWSQRLSAGADHPSNQQVPRYGQ